MQDMSENGRAEVRKEVIFKRMWYRGYSGTLKTNLLQDKVNTSSLSHGVRQINSLGDLGVTFGCGCHDVSTRVKQSPIVSFFSWKKGNK